MRLVCPNCGAQYEVDDRLIPESGRDVQCSNCGHTWFQHPAGHAPEAAGETAEAAPEPAEPDTPPQTDESAPPESAPETETAPEPEPESEEPRAEEPGEDTPPPEATATPRALDENLGALLREEAEREARARAHERQQIETQEELGLEEAETAEVAAQERMARLRGLDSEEDSASAGEAGTRRDLLPDIDEINSSLTSIGSEEVVDDFAEPARRGGFGRGFVLMLLLALIAVLLYIYAPAISQKVPALAGAMETYVGLIDQARAWLDSMVAAALARLQG